MADPRGNFGEDVFPPVPRELSLTDKVTSAITDAILGGKLQSGEVLPSERELGERFGVSRTVIREAIRSLTASGLVEARSGRGSEVSRVGPDAISRAMNLYLRGSAEIDYAAVHEVRAPIEIEMAGHAAERATDADLESLKRRLEAMKEASDSEELARLDKDFHRALAEATHNELFVVMLDSIGGVLLDIRRIAFSSPDMRDYAVQAHEEILRNVVAGDAEGSRRSMRRHLEEAATDWSGVAGDGVDG